MLRRAGQWGSGDDRRLIRALLASGVKLWYEADWDRLVPGRSAKQSRRRWRLMTRRVPDNADAEFHEQLEYLAKTFTPDLWKKYRGDIGKEASAGNEGDKQS